MSDPGNPSPSTGPPDAMSTKKPAERIGILLVHGMGEQQPGQHLSRHIHDLTKALMALPDVRDVQQRIVSTTPPCIGLTIVQKGTARQSELTDKTFEIREAFWADLDRPYSRSSRLRFWLWGLGQWATRPLTTDAVQNRLAGAQSMKPPRTSAKSTEKSSRQKTLYVRIRLFLTAYLVVSVLPVAKLFGAILAKLGLASLLPGKFRGGNIIRAVEDYLGDVKIYTDEKLAEAPVLDAGDKPRAAIRRRIYSSLLDMALGNYDRWYIVSHSLGSVLAFNMLMDTGASLINAATPEQIRELRKNGFLAAAAQPDRVMPRRPDWVGPHETICRKALFETLQGFVTYGSPLDKFAAIWPGIVAVNGEQGVFRADFEWINFYEQADFIGASLDAFDMANLKAGDGKEADIHIRNIGVNRHWEWTAHTHYFADAAKAPSTAQDYARWLLDPHEKPAKNAPKGKFWEFLKRNRTTPLIALAALFVIPAISIAMLAFPGWLEPVGIKWSDFWETGWRSNPVFWIMAGWFLACLLTVSAAGGIKWRLDLRHLGDYRKEPTKTPPSESRKTGRRSKI